ncbi:MAG: hypothetical protein ACE5K8_09480 [Candidatus Zixiibacteriota bacterium]
MWFLAGWLVLFAALFPQSVVVCFGEPVHVELEVLGVMSCCVDPELTSGSAGIAVDLPTGTCVDCDHARVSSSYYYSTRQISKDFGRHINVRNQPVCVLAPTFSSGDKRGIYHRPGAVYLIQPLLIEHLSTTILIC